MPGTTRLLERARFNRVSGSPQESKIRKTAPSRRLGWFLKASGGVLLGVLVFRSCGKLAERRMERSSVPRTARRTIRFDSDLIPADHWPASWFEDPRTASEFGIADFSESPFLTSRVDSGELPPVAERLPEDPVVVEPYERVGVYGGSARVAGPLLMENYLRQVEAPLRMCPEASKVRLNLLKGLDVCDEGRIFTLRLREGVRWSDGQPHSAEDYIFWFERVFMNRELTPVAYAPFFDDTEIRKLDEHTVQYVFASPSVYFPNTLAHVGFNYRVPAHYARAFHPDFVDPEALEARARERGFISWMAYYNTALRGIHGRRIYPRPTLRAFRLVSRTHQRFYYERNPYYSKVDPDGRQLPYIDTFVRTEMDRELVKAQTAAGNLTISGVQLMTSDIPFMLRNEARGGYRTYLWNNYFGSDVVITINQTHSDPKVNAILTDVRFRRALSLSIDREEINDILYFGQGAPRTMFVMPTSKFYDPEVLAGASIDYDPEAAERLLDDMGMVDRTGDGHRNRPGGGKLNLVVELAEDVGVTPKRETMELVIDHWRRVGLDIQLRLTTDGFYSRRGHSNLIQMGVWHGDRVGDTLFPNEPDFFVPYRQGRMTITWGEWVRWFATDGESGMEPCPEGKLLMEWWREMGSSMDRSRRIELGRKIMRSQAENLWSIGIIGMTPKPLVISDKLQNVPVRGYWGWDTRLNYPYHPETYFLGE